MKPTKRQLELLRLCGFEFVDNKFKDFHNRNMLVDIIYESDTGLFTLETKGKRFDVKDYDSVEAFTIDVNHVLGLIYELNLLNENEN